LLDLPGDRCQGRADDRADRLRALLRRARGVVAMNTHSTVGWLFGLLLGMRHALEPDHLTAVSMLVARDRRAVRGAWLGAWWGLGHSISLLVVGSALALFHASMPPRLASIFELAVSAMLIALGVRSISRSFAQERDGQSHDRRLCRDHVHVGRWTFATRSLAIGLVHGLAGTGALVALVVAELPSAGLRIAYMAVFGIGSVLGMALVSGFAGISIARFSRTPRVAKTIVLVTGAFSIALGVRWAVALL
jgi:hypothetical protein